MVTFLYNYLLGQAVTPTYRRRSAFIHNPNNPKKKKKRMLLAQWPSKQHLIQGGTTEQGDGKIWTQKGSSRFKGKVTLDQSNFDKRIQNWKIRHLLEFNLGERYQKKRFFVLHPKCRHWHIAYSGSSGHYYSSSRKISCFLKNSQLAFKWSCL